GAGLGEGDMATVHQAVIDVVLHGTAADVVEHGADRLLALEHERPARRMVLVDHPDFGVIGVERRQRRGVVAFHRLAETGEIEHVLHRILPWPFLTGCLRRGGRTTETEPRGRATNAARPIKSSRSEYGEEQDRNRGASHSSDWPA